MKSVVVFSMRTTPHYFSLNSIMHFFTERIRVVNYLDHRDVSTIHDDITRIIIVPKSYTKLRPQEVYLFKIGENK